jgi:hypothetical protein
MVESLSFSGYRLTLYKMTIPARAFQGNDFFPAMVSPVFLKKNFFFIDFIRQYEYLITEHINIIQ